MDTGSLREVPHTPEMEPAHASRGAVGWGEGKSFMGISWGFTGMFHGMFDGICWDLGFTASIFNRIYSFFFFF